MTPRIVSAVVAFAAALLLSGCETTESVVKSTTHQSGPNLGHALGTPPRNNLVGSYVAAEETPAPTTVPAVAMIAGERRMMREWRYETTPDGRTIRVAYETELDAQGAPLGPGRPAKY